MPVAWFWDHTETCAVAGAPFQVLDSQANVICLAAHLALQHRLGGWHPLPDLALLIRHNHEGIDWDRVVAVAQSPKLLTVLQATLDRLGRSWPSLPLNAARRVVSTLTPSRTDARLFRFLTAESRHRQRLASAGTADTALLQPTWFSRRRHAGGACKDPYRSSTLSTPN